MVPVKIHKEIEVSGGDIRISQKTHQRIVVFCVTFFLLYHVPLGCTEYYADINITVDDAGLVRIEGPTNHPDLLVEQSEMYTFKKQSYWLLNITIDEVFSDYIYTISLPQGASINYIKTSGFQGINEEMGHLIITGSGGNESLSLVVQYQINQRSLDLTILGLLLLILIGIALVLLSIIFHKKRNKPPQPSALLNQDQQYNFRGLTPRQKQIMSLLIEINRPITQGEIEKHLSIPKAAVSRNVHSLELKGLLDIEKIGMSNLIRLKKR